MKRDRKQSPPEEAKVDLFELADITSDQQLESIQRKRTNKLIQKNGQTERTR